MAEPTQALSFSDLVLRVAEETGMAYYGSTGQSKPTIPIDPADLDRCKRIVTDAYRQFMADGPVNGWKWLTRIHSVTFVDWTSGKADSGTATTLVDADRTEADDYYNGYTLRITKGTGAGETATITDFDQATNTLTFSGGLSGSSTPDSTSEYRLVEDDTVLVDQDPARYLMPNYFGGEVDGQIEYAANTNNGVHISWVDEAFIRARRTPVVITSYPLWAAIRPYQPENPPSLNNNRKFELLVDPQPSTTDTVEFPINVTFDKMELEAGQATGGSATTLVDSDRTELDDHFNTWVLTILEGTGIGETATITDYTQSTGTFTFSALSGGSTPDTTTVYKVEPANNYHPAGYRFDQAVKAACFAQAEMEISEFDKGHRGKYYEWDLPRAWDIDKRSAPRTLGNMNRPRIPRYPTRTWFDVTTDHDL
jgi:hypothetical protein